MFTGIVEDLGKTISVSKSADCWKVKLHTSLNLTQIHIGDSLSINGVCLTVISKDYHHVYVEIVRETLEKTNLIYLKPDDMLNIERAMKLSDRVNGHFVQGHIEGIAEIKAKIKGDKETRLKIELNKNVLKYCIYKGSICLDGISLTIADIKDTFLECSIIPHTLENTTLLFKDKGDYLNVETDMLSKYVEKNLQFVK